MQGMAGCLVDKVIKHDDRYVLWCFALGNELGRFLHRAAYCDRRALQQWRRSGKAHSSSWSFKTCRSVNWQSL